MSVFDIMQQHTVIVGGGSGVLIQPMTDEYSYILTAKHNLLIDSLDNQSGIKKHSEIKLTTFNDDSLTVIDVYAHQDLDIAVIKIGFRQGIEVYPYQKSPRLDDAIMLYGYPEEKRSAKSSISEQIESYHLIIHEPLDERISFRNSDMASIDNINGFSGGGFFHVDEDLGKVFLVGIENAMDTRVIESHERVKGIPIASFTGFLTEKKLAPLKPIYLSGFKYLNKSIFDLNNCVNQKNISDVKSMLSNIYLGKTEETTITPCDILSKFKQNLKVFNRVNSELEEESLWIAVLELLVLTDLLGSSEEWNEAYIDTLFKSFRFIFIHSKNGWKRHLQDILSTPTEGLNDNGKILLVIRGDLPTYPLIPKELIMNSVADITKGISGETIANVKRTISSNISIIHWLKLHSVCISEKEFEYKDWNLVEHKDEIHRMLSGDYSRYLKP